MILYYKIYFFIYLVWYNQRLNLVQIKIIFFVLIKQISAFKIPTVDSCFQT